MLERQHFFLERHHQLFAVLGRPRPELRMLSDEISFLLELSTNDVVYAAVVQNSVDDD